MAEFAQILIKAKDQTRGAFDSAAANVRGLETAASKLNGVMGAIGIAGGLSAAGLGLLAKRGIDAADAMNDLSVRTGVSVKTLAGWQLAADQSGTSLDALGKGVQRLGLSIGQAEQGAKTQAEALQRLGITAKDPERAFEQLADAVANSSDKTRTNADLNDVLGRSYTELLPLLAGGAQGLRDSAAASASFAESMAELAPNADQFNDQLAVLKINAAGAAASILSQLVPSLNEYIAVGKEVVKSGSWIDKLRFFALGNASDDMIGKVRQAAAEAKQAAAEAAARARDLAGSVALPAARPAARPARQPKTSGGIDKLALQYDDLERAMKDAADESERLGESAAFEASTLLETQNAVNAVSQEWVEAGRALTIDVMTPLEKVAIETARIQTLLDKGLITQETADRAGAALEASLIPKLEKTKSLGEEIGLTFTSAFEDAIVKGGDFSDMLAGLEQDLLRLAARKLVTEPLMSAFAGFLPFAAGGAIGGGALSAYSNSIVTRPTVFPFADGGVPNLGLMGEAGAEAILPLKRGPGGALGVQAAGNVQVNVINNANGTQATASERQDGDTRIIDVMIEQVKSAIGGDIARGGGPVSGAIERTYGLNRTAGAY